MNEQETKELGMTAISYMQEWDLNTKQQLFLLNLDIKPRLFPAYSQGKKILPDDENILNRAKHIVGIGGALRGYFPLNYKGGSIWLKNTNKYFPEKSPLMCMFEDGLPGMFKVWVNLDCTIGWD